MRAMKCDRCGRLYEHYNGCKTFRNGMKSNGLFLIDRDLDGRYFTRKDYDLCPDCVNELEKFILCDCDRDRQDM